MNNLAGTVLLQRFRMDALERQDYLGDDYRSWDLKRNLPLQIKVLRAELPYDPSLLSFQQGNTTLQTLNHPHIVPFYGLYQDHHISFMVEKYVDGQPLGESLLEMRGQPARTGDALIYLKALCQGLAYAQGFGIVHCGVNPFNIWRHRNGNILLGGFGFARGIESRMSAAGEAGPPIYVAPEILRGEEVSPATDIYSLGLVLFELLTGQHPFFAAASPGRAPVDPDQIRAAQLTQAPPNPRKLNPAIPEGLGQVLTTALAKTPKERYQSPQEMLEIACAMLGSSPEAIPDRFDNPNAADETLIVSAPKPAQVSPAPPPRTPTPAVVPGQVQAAPPSYPPPYPATQVMPTIPPGKGTPEVHPRAGAPMPAARKQERSASSWLIVAGIVLAILACVLVSAAAAYFFGQGLLQSPTAPTSTAPLLSTATLPASATPVEVIVPPTGQSQVLPPTDTPTLPPTDLPAPTDTPVPTDTPEPTSTSIPTAFTVTIRNNLSFPVYAFRDGRLMGTDSLQPRTYIFYRGIPTGLHTFTVCETPDQAICQPERQVNVSSDLTITFP